ncbi:MAG: hypothetical protein DRQ10_05285 [Candidatus Hydrothermota bacterium]|nr:MAG: hypothetical protein DRQ10_05285 [Candidatus Hydrothermae bacterium]
MSKICWVVSAILLIVTALLSFRVKRYMGELKEKDAQIQAERARIDSLTAEIQKLQSQMSQLETFIKATAAKPQVKPSEQPEVEKLGLTRYEKQILDLIVNNPDIDKLVKFKPTLPGRSWICSSPLNVRFLSEDKVLIIFEDGLISGALIAEITDPNDITKWKVLWQTLLE